MYIHVYKKHIVQDSMLWEYGWVLVYSLPVVAREEDLMPGSLCRDIPGTVNTDTAVEGRVKSRIIKCHEKRKALMK